MNEYTIDYDELSKIYRLETKSPKLTKLNPSFYKELKKFITQEKSKYVSAIENLSQVDLKKFETLKQTVNKIREIRLKKCLNLCLTYSRTKDFSEDNLIDFEIDFVKDILKLLDKQAEYTDGLFGSKAKNADKQSNLIKVIALSNIPSFIGSDMKEYGPFDKDNVCEIPENIFTILFSKNIVKKIE
jgi:DNA replication initiation complex subunit (GINS family)